MLSLSKMGDHVSESSPSLVSSAALVIPDKYKGGKDAEGVAVPVTAKIRGKPKSKRKAAPHHCHAEAPADHKRNRFSKKFANRV